MSHQTLIDLFQSRAGRLGERRAYTFLADGERELVSWSYADLERKARAIAAHLHEHLGPGERALLAFPPGLDFIAAFFGCVYAGAIAVPVPLPHPRRGHERLEAIARDCDARVLLSTRAGLAALAAPGAGAARLAHIAAFGTDDFADDAGDAWREPAIGPETLALLQYTSGSTAAPKGVKVTHANVLANLAMIHEAEGNDEMSRGVSWLPAYHDMGLIEGVLEPLYGGYPTWLMSPAAFLQKPARWLKAISHHGGTVSGAPNFAFDLCVRRVPDEDLSGIDLSTWRVAYNGAEPVRADTLAAFAQRFAPCGFSAAALRPVYGLAEATALVSASAPEGPRLLQLDRGALAQGRAKASSTLGEPVVDILSCGRAPSGTMIAIVDPQSERRLASGEVGEICVAGPSVTHGYWLTIDATPHSLSPAPEYPRWLRTGDLGLLHEGELYVTGRIKDLIILRGKKFYPQDIERTVEKCHVRVSPEGVAAFAVGDMHGERLVVVVELEDSADLMLQSVTDAIGQAVFREHECAIHEAVLVRRGALPRTSSGKLMRFRCRDDYLAQTLPALIESQPCIEADRRVA